MQTSQSPGASSIAFDPATSVHRPQKTSRHLIILAVVAVCGLTFGLRCLHLLNGDHYFVISPDSHYFHRMAQLLVQDETYFYPTHGQIFPISMFSGIAYPLAVIATVVAALTPVSTAESLEIVSKFMPPVLGVVTALVLYLSISRMYGPRVGLFAAFAWATVPMAIVHHSAGYLDRDCLSILLVVVGAFLFYALSGPTSAVGLARFQWIIAALAVIAVEILLYIEWGFLGPVILLTVVAAFFLLQILTDVMTRAVPRALAEEDPFRMLVVFAQCSLASLLATLKGSLARSIAVILALNLLLAATRPSLFQSLYDLALDVMGGAAGGQQTVAELQGLGVGDIFSYSFLLIPAAVGIYICLRRRKRADVLVVAWFAALFLGGLFARRLFIYAAPSVCILAAVGLGALLDTKGFRPSLTTLWALPWVNPRGLLPYLRFGLAILVILVTLWNSYAFGYSFGSDPAAAADNDWQDALSWLKHHTPHDAVVMTWWDYGYWILDIAERVPVADNGHHPEDADADIARVYCAFDDHEAVGIMKSYGVDYLLFARRDVRLLPVITRTVLNVTYGDGLSIPGELEGSLYARSFSEEFYSAAGLERVYRSPDSSLVILAVT